MTRTTGAALAVLALGLASCSIGGGSSPRSEGGATTSTEAGGRDGSGDAEGAPEAPGRQPLCTATGTLAGGTDISFQDTPVGVVTTEGSAHPTFFQAAIRDVAVVVRLGDGDRPATVNARSDQGTWSALDPEGLIVDDDGRRVELAEVALDGPDGGVTANVTFTCV